MGNKHNSLHLGRKHARIIWPWTLASAFPRSSHVFRGATLSENCSLLRTDNVRRQIFQHILAPNGSYCLYIFVFKNFYIFSFSASDDCEECGNFVRHIFSIAPGSLAIISLLIVLLFQHSHTTWKKNGKIVQTTCVNDYLLYTFQLPFEQLFSPIAFIWIIFFKNSVQL